MNYWMITCALGTMTLAGHAQRHSENWVFGRDIWLNFAGPTVNASLSSYQAGARTGCISDTSGNFVLIADSTGIRDALFQLMPGGEAATLGWGTPARFMVLPKPGNHDRYVVLINEDLPGQRGGAVEVDISLNNGLGAVVGTTSWYTDSVTAKLAATPHANGTGYWIIQHQDGTDVFASYLLTATGIDPQPVITHAGSDFIPSTASTESMDRWGPMTFNPQGDMLAMATHGPSPDTSTVVELYHFDDASGIISTAPFATIDRWVHTRVWQVVGTDTIVDTIPQWFPQRHWNGLDFDHTGQYLYASIWDTIPTPPGAIHSEGQCFLEMNVGSQDEALIQASLHRLTGYYSLLDHAVVDRHGTAVGLAPNGQLILRVISPPWGHLYRGINLPHVVTNGGATQTTIMTPGSHGRWGLPLFCKRYLSDLTTEAPPRTDRPDPVTLAVRPQPVLHQAVLDMQGLGFPDRLHWFDASGQLVRQESARINGPTVVLDRSGLPAGLYLVAASRMGRPLGQVRVMCE